MRSKALVAAAAIFLALADGAAAQVKTLVFCADDSPDSLNPQLSYRQATFDASRQVYDRLVAYEPGSTQIVPSLAASWTVSKDGLRYEFRLRHGVTFHERQNFKPTRPLNAADVVFSFMRQLDPEHPYHRISGDAYPYFRGLGLAEVLETVRAADENTVVFELTRPFPALIAVLALDFASILSAEYADAMLAAGTPGKLDFEPVGTGPFQLVQHQRDALIRYVAYPGYWRGKAPLDNLVFQITPDATVRYQKLRDSECDVIADPDPADIPAMMLDGDIELVRQVRMDIGYLAFNTRRYPLHDPRVRRALAMAIDRARIVREVYQSLGRPAGAMLPPGLWSQGEAPPEPDPEAARRLLAQTGVDNLELEIWPTPVSRPYMPDARRVAEMIREDWRAIGVDATVVATGGRDFIKQTMVGEHDVALFGWIAETMDRSMFLEPILSCAATRSGANRAFWCNAGFDRLLQEAALARSASEKETLFGLASSILAEDRPVLPIASSVSVTPIRREVVNYRPSPLGGHTFYGVDLR